MPPYPIEQKLVIAVSSSALFDLTESNAVFEEKGPVFYKQFQEENLDVVLDKGVAFPFIKRFLNINSRFVEQQPVEVVLLSKNSAATGKRVFRSIEHYGLDITRAAFMEGKSPYEYIPAFNAALFLSANEADVLKAIESGYPAGVVLPSKTVLDDDSEELRIAFDFDGVIVDDEAEAIFQEGALPAFQAHEAANSGIPHHAGPLAPLFKALSFLQKLEDDEAEAIYQEGALPAFQAHEAANSGIPHHAGPLAHLFKALSFLQKLEDEQVEQNHGYKRIIRTSIVTMRSAPSHERVVTTLEDWGVSANETFFLGGMEKDRVLSRLKPHMFFDDQRGHLQSKAGDIPMVHIPFGIANEI